MLSITTNPHLQPEKEYIFHVLLREILGIAYRFEYAPSDVHTLKLPNGSELSIKDGFHTIELFTIQEQKIQYSENWEPALFDPFAASFFMLARLEELDKPKLNVSGGQMDRDTHGRFPAEKSRAWQQGFLHRPVVNEWADMLWDALLRLGWQGERKQRKFQISLSCDVDHPRLWWSAADRAKTLAGAIFKRGNMQEPSYWLKNHVFHKQDPYDVFEAWFDLFEKNNLVAQFNFMGERPRSSDCWYPIRHPFIKNLMHRIAARGHKIGFHPSYEAFDDSDIFNRELASLQEISPLLITSGRQHYLRFKAPNTWSMWENAGLEEDCTLGYPEAEGFRCGICHDFPVFDTGQRKMLHLREKPLIAMDVTLAQYRHYTPEQAYEKLIQLRNEVEKHGGDFALLWHNSSWNSPFWEAWKVVMEAILSK